ncbi:hypothetical protein L195_g044084 [Trifolium pratense]|uniref:RALF-like protein n=1 Tax=Trifolium pratense TaxID=57577 RepID=A0A2K3MB23_TRIPR|nr:hypothetical protein L195_g044084 [Trifolium pratense]
MAKIVLGSLVLVLIVMAILNGHIEAAGRGTEPGKDGNDYKPQWLGGFPIPPPEKILPCIILFKFCLFIPSFCPEYQKLCLYNKSTQVVPNQQQTVAKASTP